jgi:hypothetical protein
MQSPSISPQEIARQAELDAAEILDTPPEAEFDQITEALANRLGVPIALVSLVDRDRQWFKSRHGLAATQTPREVSFCGHGFGFWLLVAKIAFRRAPLPRLAVFALVAEAVSLLVDIPVVRMSRTVFC